jgi:tRNA (mo5U34)-methyltransferase
MNHVAWWHCININGIVTPGANRYSQKTFDNLWLPQDMSGLTVLDIGAWDGFYSFSCEQRGATVTASDKIAWTEIGTKDAGFDYARKQLGSSVKKVVASVEELDPKVHGTFDYVLMLGVIYHAKDIIGYLAKARSLSKSKVIIETHTACHDIPYPAVRYYVGSELVNDPTNFWGPNPAAVVGMMTDIGFTNIQQKHLFNDRMIFMGDA